MGWDVCNCICHKHRKGIVKHCLPCCDGECPICGLLIKYGKMKKHMKKHNKEAIRELEKRK